MVLYILVFFFSSRRRHTRWPRDWSSDVCSSDLCLSRSGSGPVKSMAAGYYEYSPMLFDGPGLAWTGPDPERLKHDHKVWPDFHHTTDLVASGRVVDFLPKAAADAFCLRGGPAEIIAQLLDVLRSAPVTFDHVVLHPVPNPTFPDDPERGYMARVAREILPAVRSALGAPSTSERRDVTR